jgi:uncharacterized membrane protein YdbT with pleckstrin-like domain
MNNEHILWQSRPSHLINLSAYLFWLTTLLIISAVASIDYTPLSQTPYLGRLSSLIAQIFAPWPILNTLYAIIAMIILYRFISVFAFRYQLSDERLICRNGLLNRQVDEIEIYRIKDFEVTLPLLMRLVGKGNVVLYTSDRTHPKFLLQGIKQPERVRNLIRDNVERLRSSKGVREID